MPPIPGVGDRSRIGQLLLAMQADERDADLRKRALDQQGFSTLAGLGLNVSDLVSGNIQQVEQRGFAGEQAGLDRDLRTQLLDRSLEDAARARLGGFQERAEERGFQANQDELNFLREQQLARQAAARQDLLGGQAQQRADAAAADAERVRTRERREDIRLGQTESEAQRQGRLDEVRLKEELGADRDLEEFDLRRELAQPVPLDADRLRQLAIAEAVPEIIANRMTPAQLSEKLSMIDQLAGLLEPGGTIESIEPQVLPRFNPTAVPEEFQNPFGQDRRRGVLGNTVDPIGRGVIDLIRSLIPAQGAASPPQPIEERATERRLRAPRFPSAEERRGLR